MNHTVINTKVQNAVGILVEKGNNPPDISNGPVIFTDDPAIDFYLNDIVNYPHFFVLACILDRQIKSENVWKIPYYISKASGSTGLESFCNITLSELEEIFRKNHLHRSNRIAAEYLCKAAWKIKNDYNGDASLIWQGNPSCETVVQRFLEFEGVCINTAYMATNILVRDFRIPLTDRSCLDISPLVPVRRVFIRLGFIPKNATRQDLIDCARVLNPEYPGVFDLPVQEVSREWCKPVNPDCSNCFLVEVCQKKNIKS